MELDTSGSIIWRKEYPIAGVQSAQDMKATPDGGYLLTGWTWDGCSTCWEDGFLLKTDSLGNQQWYERYGGTHSDYFNTLTLSPDGGYVMGGTTYNANNSGRPWLLKTDSLGNQLWSRTYGNTQSIGFGVAPTTDGGYLLAGGVDDGTSDYDACLIKTNAHGMQQWRTCIPVPFLSEDFAFPLEQPDGTYIAVGNFSNPNQQFKPQSHMVAFSQTGDTLWRRTYEHYQNKDAYVYDIKPLPGGGVGMVGAVLNNDLPQKNDMWLVTTDACGYTSTNSPQVQAGFNISSSGSLLFLFQNQTLNGCRYTWDFGDGNTSQQQNPEHQYAVAGNYTLTLIACAGINCDTLTQTITVAGAAEELGKEEQPKIIPNPNSGEFWLTYALQPDEGKLCIYNVVGRLVHQEPILQWSQVKRVNLKHLPEGVYHSRLVWKGKTGVVRFVKW